MNYMFESPTRIYYGDSEEKKVGLYIRLYGYKKILMVYGKKSAKTSGLYQKVVDSLKENEIEFIELGGIDANPTLEMVNKGLSLIKNKDIDMILALGGGSVIDASKSIANGYYYDGNPFDFNERKAQSNKALPVGVILTIPASGSELSTSCVISDESRHLKRGFNSQNNRPLFVIESVELINGLPFNQLAYGIVDILAHSMERYFCPSAKYEFADYMALGLMKSVVDSANVLLDDFNNQEARKTLILASSFSHNGLTSIAKTFTMQVHQLEHELSGLYPNIAHGLGLAILFPYWMKETYKYDPKKFALFAKVLFNIKGDDDIILAKEAINEYQNLLKRLQLPTTLKEINVSYDDLEKLAQPFAARKILGIRTLDQKLAYRIFVRAWEGK